MDSLPIEKATWLSLFLVLASVGMASGTNYKVGDDNGWSLPGNVNYTAWAASKIFHIGDVLLFEYKAQYHSVLQVTRESYHSCSTAYPIAQYKTGNDSITIYSGLHLYFICGTPTHCEAGQKLGIRITHREASAERPSPSIELAPAWAPAPSTANHAIIESAGLWDIAFFIGASLSLLSYI